MSSHLTPEERELLEELFDRAVELPQEDHGAFVDKECPEPGALRDALAGLLRGLARGHAGQDALKDLQQGAPSRDGERIGSYILRERIGTGGMGEVYAADQVGAVERRVAVKYIRSGMDSAQVVARFDAERQALARMAHPHVAQVFDAGAASDGRPYFVMELVQGGPITEYCDTHRLSTHERLRLFIGVCEGVEHAHQKGLIHRDLKPSNILVAEQDGRAVPKIIDFGVARATTGRLGADSLLTMAGQVVGTLDYMSPEQAVPGDAETDTRSDVYSLGVVLYQLLTGLLPIDRASTAPGNLAEIQRAIREDDPLTPSRRFRREASTQSQRAPLHGTDERSLIRQLSGDLDWISLKALEKDPARRYQSASELAADIHRHLDHLPVQARKPSTLYRTSKFIRRHRVGALAGALVAAALLTGIAGVVSGQVKAAARGKELARLSDGARLAALLKQADGDYWPLDPNVTSVERLELWQARAHDLAAGLEQHRQTKLELERLSRDGASGAELADRNRLAFERQWQLDEVSKLVLGIETLKAGLIAEDGISDEHGWSMPRRIAVMRDMQRQFAEGGDYHAAWAEALPKIRAHRADLDGDGVEELVYPELELTIQPGLVPLGPDPDSHLWEFAHVVSGSLAHRAVVDGRLVRTAETGLVLVLIPGGTFDMGSQFVDPKLGNYVNPRDRGPREGPVHSVTEEAFFLSKFEMTQRQWESFHGVNPSGFGGPTPPEPELADVMPVHNVSWDECSGAMGRLGLCLPTEPQWEYAARGGRDRARWTGVDAASLESCENILDESRGAENNTMGSVAPFSDAFPGLAPVGSFKANPYGLHDVLGNVAEWTASHPSKYKATGDPVNAKTAAYLSRGGSFFAGPEFARAAFRGWSNGSGFKIFHLGVRPARAITRD